MSNVPTSILIFSFYYTVTLVGSSLRMRVARRRAHENVRIRGRKVRIERIWARALAVAKELPGAQDPYRNSLNRWRSSWSGYRRVPALIYFPDPVTRLHRNRRLSSGNCTITNPPRFVATRDRADPRIRPVPSETLPGTLWFNRVPWFG